jgi:GPH family glycoside/pentoside/hexuronide:cation symporter
MSTDAIAASPKVVPRLAAPGRWVWAAYGVGQISGQILRDVPSLLLLFFMTNILAVPPALAGAAIFVPKLIFGVICDFSVGALSDRWSAPRRRWLLIGAVGAPAAMVLLFASPPFADPTLRAAYVAGALVLYMLVFSLSSVPYLAISAESAPDAATRTTVMAWRLAFTGVGVLVGGAITPIVIQRLGADQHAYHLASMGLGGTCALALLIAYAAALTLPASAKRPATGVARPFAALADRQFLVLGATNLLQLAGSGMAYAGMLYFFTYIYRMGIAAYAQIGIAAILMSVAVVVSQPGWVWLARRLGKKAVYVGSALGFGLLSLAWLLTDHDLRVIYAIAIVFGAFNSGWTLMSFALLSDLAAKAQETRGGAVGGAYSAAWIALDKIGFALGGTLIIGLVLQLFGFTPQAAAAGAAGPHLGIIVAYTVMPCLFNLLAGALYFTLGRPAAD